VNKVIPQRTQKEYKEEHKEEIKARSKQYNEDHKEEHNAYSAQYGIDNLEKIEERRSVKTTCPCGSVIRFDSRIKHERSPKHLAFLSNQL
jgi:hypothetical protein